MRFRKFAGIAAGALTAGLLTVPAMSGTAQAATVTGNFGCTMTMMTQTFPMEYDAKIDLSASRVDSSTVSITADFNDLPGVVPVGITGGMTMSSKLDITANGAAATLAGEDSVESLAPRAPIPVPTVSGKVKNNGTSVAVDVKRLSFEATAMGIPVSVICTPTAPISSTMTVPGPVAKAAKTKSVTKVKLAKNGKKATITTTVKAGKKNASGKVTITVKKGKKVVAKKTVSLKKGKAKLVVKKGSLKAKGKYVVSAQFKGSKNFKKSNAKKASFKVKK